MNCVPVLQQNFLQVIRIKDGLIKILCYLYKDTLYRDVGRAAFCISIEEYLVTLKNLLVDIPRSVGSCVCENGA